MNEHIEDIVNDLYTLDPTLREEDSHIRMLVTRLIAAKPHIKIDETFLKRLRAELLMSAQNKPMHSARPQWEWWMFRLVPLGAVAVLLIVLVPQLTQVGVPTQEHDTSLPPQTPTARETSGTTEGTPDTFSTLMQKSAPVTVKQLGFIRGVTLGAAPQLSFDDAMMLTGKEAEDAAIAAGVCTEEGRSECLTNDYFIQNIEKKDVIVPIDKNVRVVMRTLNAEAQGIADTGITLSSFAKLINDKTKFWNTLPYNVTTENGKITLIEEVYIP